MKFLTALCLVTALAGCNQGPADKTAAKTVQAASAEVFEYGIYKMVDKGEVVDDPATSTGKSLKNLVIEHVEQTDRIPIEKDIYFGYQYRIDKLPAEMLIKPQVALRRVLIHPPMTLPDGSQKSGSERMIHRDIKDGSVAALDGYALNEDYEMVEGEWIFQIWYRDQKLIEQKFIAYHPEKPEAS
jgi:hypothetical protein